MVRAALVALGASAVLAQDDVQQKWDDWKAAYGEPNDEAHEMEVFRQNLMRVEELQRDDPTATYSHMSPFANLSPEEFKVRLGYHQNEEITDSAPELDIGNLADDFDWVKQGAVNAIKDQKQCGSCWAFATVANIEGVGMVETGKLQSLSEQQLVDCDRAPGGDQGCNGGLPENAYKYMIKNKMGLELESAYPYKARNGVCQASAAKEKVFVSSWKQISTNEQQIAAAVQQYGPLAIGINANTMQMYSGGVANPSAFLCNPQSLDHGVAIVGFGNANGQPYWKIRNSWGTSWGERGYYRIVRGKGACGLNTDVTTAQGVSTESAVQEEPKYAKGFVRMPRNKAVPAAEITQEMRDAAPATLDWTTKGATSPVKDQGSCGSCWAFSATEGIESGVFMTTGQLPPALSTQQIISCDKSDLGCNGGDLPTAFEYVENAGGIDTASDYPDKSHNTGRSGVCKSHSNTVKVTGYKYAVPPCEGGACKNQDEDGLKAALNTYGPLSVCVNAGSFNSYYGGVLKTRCSGSYNSLDHCVQLVGYDTTASTPFWKVKNSWASDWGEQGFIRLPMGKNSCGIADEAMYVTATMASTDVTV